MERDLLNKVKSCTATHKCACVGLERGECAVGTVAEWLCSSVSGLIVKDIGRGDECAKHVKPS